MSPAPAEEQLNGQIERITFHSEDTGFAVLRLKVRGHRELVTAVGQTPTVSVGEWVDAQGHWVVDPKHGPQFRFRHLRATAPDTLEGIEKYLGSGMIRGIGPVYAAKMVGRFGKDIFRVIETQSAALESIDGIGPRRRRQIREAWNEQKAVRDIMAFLFSHGVSTARAFRIFKTYGEQAIETVQHNPYCLVRDIRGIGFKTADQIAIKVGIARESDLRARAGVAYVLQELTADGHCAYPDDSLVEKAADILGIGSPIIEQAIDHEIAARRLVREAEPDSPPLIYLAGLHAAEQQLSGSLVGLAGGRPPWPSMDAGKAIEWVQQQLKLRLASGQREAIAAAVRSKLMVITGGPGVGKTTLVNALLRILTAKKVATVLCAPTGRAAKRLSETTGRPAKTIHRLLAFDPQRGQFKFNRDHRLTGDAFVVDETSMIDLMLAHQLVQAIPDHAALFWVGDVDQLPSVGPGTVLRDIIESGVVPVSRLDHVFRQAAESAIISNAHRVNQGRLPRFPASRDDPSDCYLVQAEDPESARDRIVQLVRQAVPRRFGLDPGEDIQVVSPMQRGELGARNLNHQLQQALNPNGESIERYGIEFRVGDRVMQVLNNYDKEVFNGDIGRIERLDREEGVLTVRFDDRRVAYSFPELDELVLAYAITIHKSQGSEYPCVIIPFHTQHYVMLQRNLLYTAMTRGRRLVILVGTNKALAIAIGNVGSQQRITRLRSRLRKAAAGAPPDPRILPSAGGADA